MRDVTLLVKIVLCLSLISLLATTVWAQQQEAPEKFTLSLTTHTELPMFEMLEMPDMGDMEGMYEGTNEGIDMEDFNLDEMDMGEIEFEE